MDLSNIGHKVRKRLRTCARREDSDQSAHARYDQNLPWVHFDGQG